MARKEQLRDPVKMALLQQIRELYVQLYEAEQELATTQVKYNALARHCNQMYEVMVTGLACFRIEDPTDQAVFDMMMDITRATPFIDVPEEPDETDS